MVSIGSCVLALCPRIALAIDDSASRAEVDAAIKAGADIVELRIDRFRDMTAAHVLEVFERYAGLPRIGTIRTRREGGGWDGTEEERLGLFTAIMPRIEAVDIELASNRINRKVIELAASQDKTIIGSFHDFEKTPALDIFQSLIDTAQDLGVTIIKFAAQCAGPEDVRRMGGMLLNNPDKPMIVLGMGSAGRISRFLFPALGSLVTYTFLETPSAPGQASLEETLHLMNLLYERNK